MREKKYKYVQVKKQNNKQKNKKMKRPFVKWTEQEMGIVSQVINNPSYFGDLEKAFTDHPDWKEALNNRTRGAIYGKINYESEKLKGKSPSEIKGRKQKKFNLEKQQVQAIKSSHGINFCPSCGCNLNAIQIALDLTK